jgi:hypothetical protein
MDYAFESLELQRTSKIFFTDDSPHGDIHQSFPKTQRRKKKTGEKNKLISTPKTSQRQQKLAKIGTNWMPSY